VNEYRTNQITAASLNFLRIGIFIVLAIALIQCTVAFSASPSEIVIRFLNMNSGKPLTGVQVQISTWNSPAPHREADITTLNAKTDKTGKILIHLQEPLAKYLSFRSPNELRECSDQEFAIADAIQSGIVAKLHAKCGQLKFAPTAKPGEIIVFDKKYRFLD
jgi:hypothetical protein